MKRIFGGLLMLAGAVALYIFTTRAMYFGREQISAVFDVRLPLLLAGLDYPTGALILAGAAWGFILGLWFIVTGGDDASEALRGGRIARLMLLNGLLLLSTLGVGYLGARNNGGTTLVAVFGLIAAAQVVFGALLLVLSLFERPKGIASLAFGALIYLGGVGLGVMTFLWGGGP
jgi:hypothetical protein